MINPYAIGKNIYLRAPTMEDAEGEWYQWFSDPETTKFLGDRYLPNTMNMQLDYLKYSQEAKDRIILSICTIEDDKHIGTCGFSAINWFHKYADISIVIGDKNHKQGPVTIEGMSLLLEIAFKRLGLVNLLSVHVASNPFTPLINKIFGFEEVGRIKKFALYEGEYLDSIISQLARENWLARNRAD